MGSKIDLGREAKESLSYWLRKSLLLLLLLLWLLPLESDDIMLFRGFLLLLLLLLFSMFFVKLLGMVFTLSFGEYDCQGENVGVSSPKNSLDV